MTPEQLTMIARAARGNPSLRRALDMLFERVERLEAGAPQGEREPAPAQPEREPGEPGGTGEHERREEQEREAARAQQQQPDPPPTPADPDDDAIRAAIAGLKKKGYTQEGIPRVAAIEAGLRKAGYANPAIGAARRDAVWALMTAEGATAP